MPLAGLPAEGEFHVAHLNLFGLALTSELVTAERLACLSHPGINQLQQRLVFHQTRLEVPPSKFQQAFDHTYEEAELLEDWATDLSVVDDCPELQFRVLDQRRISRPTIPPKDSRGEGIHSSRDAQRDQQSTRSTPAPARIGGVLKEPPFEGCGRKLGSRAARAEG